MRELDERAEEDLVAALEMNPKLTVAYECRILDSMTRGNDERSRKLYEEGLRAHPLSLIVRGRLPSGQAVAPELLDQSGLACARRSRRITKRRAVRSRLRRRRVRAAASRSV